MTVAEILDDLLDMAKADKALKEQLLKTKESDNPLADFCKIATDTAVERTHLILISKMMSTLSL